MTYTVEISKRAQKAIALLSSVDRKRVLAAIYQLASNPRPANSLKLTNRTEWRIRVGTIRVLYTIHDEQLVVIVVNVGHRRDIYS